MYCRRSVSYCWVIVVSACPETGTCHPVGLPLQHDTLIALFVGCRGSLTRHCLHFVRLVTIIFRTPEDQPHANIRGFKFIYLFVTWLFAVFINEKNRCDVNPRFFFRRDISHKMPGKIYGKLKIVWIWYFSIVCPQWYCGLCIYTRLSCI